MIRGIIQTLRSLRKFWRMTADIEGAAAELDRHLYDDRPRADA